MSTDPQQDISDVLQLGRVKELGFGVGVLRASRHFAVSHTGPVWDTLFVTCKPSCYFFIRWGETCRALLREARRSKSLCDVSFQAWLWVVGLLLALLPELKALPASFYSLSVTTL